jgi:hypothetical protein
MHVVQGLLEQLLVVDLLEILSVFYGILSFIVIFPTPIHCLPHLVKTHIG